MKSLLILRWISIGASAALGLMGSQAIAAERVTLKYRVFSQSVSVPELTTFAEGGEVSSDVQTYLRLSGQKPETVRETLTKPVKVNPVFLDRILNSPIGEGLLDQLGQAIQTPEGGAERQALRSALVLSASGDGELSILEVLQKYPTPDVILEGDRIEGAYRRLNDLAERLKNPLGNIFK